MKTILYILMVINLLITTNLYSQVVIGNLVDENGNGLAEIFLQLYISPFVYSTTTLSDGSFSFNNISDVESEISLPSGYDVSNNYPNPFNPRTRIAITLPVSSIVKVEVFNLLGQMVTAVLEKNFNAGTNYVDIELQGLPNGFYVSRVTINNLYTVVKKLTLLYGSKHLINISNHLANQKISSNISDNDINIDSLIATSSIIGRKVFINLPNIIGDTLQLGNLTIERFCPGLPTVTYEGKTYNTVHIGDQCWLRENLDVGTMIAGIQNQSDNGTIEKYCYDDEPNNCISYGGFYQWDEAMQYHTIGGVQGICPLGWHIPTFAEFQDLATLVNGDGNSLKEIGQGTGDGQGTNQSGFSALLAGLRWYGGFGHFEYDASFWSSSEGGTNLANRLYLYYGDNTLDIGIDTKDYGFCIRCIMD